MFLINLVVLGVQSNIENHGGTPLLMDRIISKQ